MEEKALDELAFIQSEVFARGVDFYKQKIASGEDIDPISGKYCSMLETDVVVEGHRRSVATHQSNLKSISATTFEPCSCAPNTCEYKSRTLYSIQDIKVDSITPDYLD